MKTETKLDSFTQAYIECALWSSTDDNGNPLDRDHSQSDLADETLAEMIGDCEQFQRDNVDLLAKSTLTSDYAGHDFWLSRNGHGAGFWDRFSKHGDDYDLYMACDELHSRAKDYGVRDLYIGDDGKIYC